MPRFPSPSRRAFVRLLPVLLVAALAGCGGKGNRISGKVAFDGRPIPSGKIYFIPDASKGNRGTTGYANIVDGYYDTSAAGGQGVGAGPVVVAIEGFDPNTAGKTEKGDTSGEVTVKALFPRYETTFELPGSATTKDFDVPADAVKGMKKPNVPVQITP